MRLRLDRFGQEAFEKYVHRTSGSYAAALHTAVRYYLDDADSGRAAWRFPRLASPARAGETLELELDDKLHAELEREAGRQHVTPDLLAGHTILYFLADLDTGRVAARLGDAIARDAEAE